MTITTDHVLAIHSRLCQEFGGEPTVRDMDLLESLCAEPYQEVFGQVLYPGIFDKAAKFLESFVHHQLFIDGNKRTGFMTMCVFLQLSGYRFKMDQKDAFNFVMDVVQGKYPENSDIAKIIEANSIAV